ncbi:MAG TPA: transposase [Steroidobacteraceae bacterium]|jgi:REP element-mobilizing transposase RayT|nr:transposase [Steroidobacteraceae bacterium]
MPRKLRIHVAGGFYHATLRGNHRQNIFRHDGERTLLKTIVTRAIDRYQARVHAYCWMSNHIHLLVQVGEIPLGRVMQKIASEYARAFQQNLDTTGHLFENRYHATMVDTDAYLLEVVRYVHQNPVRAGLTARVGQYRWSSHAAYAGSSSEPWVTTNFALGLLAADRRRAVVRYRAFVDEMPAADVAKELAALEVGSPLLGRREFVTRHSGVTRSDASLADLIGQACRHYAVSLAELRSPSRTSRLVAARAWVARAAIRGGVATLAEIARELNRDESTIRAAMRRDADVPGEEDPQLELASTEASK